ncbi:Rha family transcriptional regulator [Chromobacterium vaccinii]|uniref:Rha family transcriptional regulator n=1 Tax=Chromobacterium vaccinii TaxID=1108595 RepID=UPI003C767405
MNELTVSNFNDFVMLAGDKIVTDSRRVAKAFNKRHGDVLRAVDRLDCGEDFSQRNFASADYLDEQGKRRREIHMTKDGFMFLVMGFNRNDKQQEAPRLRGFFFTERARPRGVDELIPANKSSLGIRQLLRLALFSIERSKLGCFLHPSRTTLHVWGNDLHLHIDRFDFSCQSNSLQVLPDLMPTDGITA